MTKFPTAVHMIPVDYELEFHWIVNKIIWSHATSQKNVLCSTASNTYKHSKATNHILRTLYQDSSVRYTDFILISSTLLSSPDCRNQCTDGFLRAWPIDSLLDHVEQPGIWLMPLALLYNITSKLFSLFRRQTLPSIRTCIGPAALEPVFHYWKWANQVIMLGNCCVIT